MDICLLALGVMVIVLLLGIVLGRRHGRASTMAVLMSALLLSFIAALAGYLILARSLETKSDTAAQWHKVVVPGGRATSLEYQAGTGLLVTTADGETHSIRDIPFCLANGKLAQLTPNYVETTTNPYVTLPQPPRPFKQQISFNLSYAINTTGLGASSFGIDDNSDVWCTERLYEASTGGLDAAGNPVLATLSMAVVIFAATFALIAIPAAVALEIRRRRTTQRLASYAIPARSSEKTPVSPDC